MIIRNATKNDKDYIVSRNDIVNGVSGISSKGKLSLNFEKDFFGENPKAHALVVEENGEIIAYAIYSFIYWSTQGQGAYLSNVYVEEHYRKKGVFKAILEKLKSFEDINFITMLIGDENESMQKTISNYGAKDVKMKMFYLK